MRFWWAAAVGCALGTTACSGDSESENPASGGSSGNGSAGSSGSGGATGGASGSAGTAAGGRGGSAGSGGAPSGGSGGTRPSPMGASCRVGDVVHPDGATGIQDPFSCNTCSCNAGALACTRIACPVECETGSPGTSCDDCGPADECLQVFHGCLPTCASAGDCMDGTICLENACRGLCG